MTDKEKEAIERLKSIDENTEEYDGKLFEEDFETVLNLIQTQQEEIEQLKNKNKFQSKEIQKAVDYTFELNKELEKKDKIIYEIAKSNVKLKGYDVEETYINNTISFYTKYIENLERNPHWREESRK